MEKQYEWIDHKMILEKQRRAGNQTRTSKVVTNTQAYNTTIVYPQSCYLEIKCTKQHNIRSTCLLLQH